MGKKIVVVELSEALVDEDGEYVDAGETLLCEDVELVTKEIQQADDVWPMECVKIGDKFYSLFVLERFDGDNLFVNEGNEDESQGSTEEAPAQVEPTRE